MGRRVNTREIRYRKKLEEERHKLIEKAIKTIPNYTPPQDYRRPAKTQEKVYVPVNDYPEINFSKILILTIQPALSVDMRLLAAYFVTCGHLSFISYICVTFCIPLVICSTSSPLT
jgi:hypothetical protein